MNISCITRSEWFDPETLNTKFGMNPDLNERAGGGVVNKYLNLLKCCPTMHFTTTFDDPDLRTVVIVEPLAFHGNESDKEKFEVKLKKLQAHKGLKFLWCEEQAVFRWTGKKRELAFETFDALLACNKYQQQLLKVIAPNKPIFILYTPIDEELYKPARNKKRQVIVAGKIGLQKNSQAIIDLFDRLPSDVHKLYIGNAGLWGRIAYEEDKKLEDQITRSADEYIKSASPIETAARIVESAVAMSMTIYDVGSLFVLESGMAGCWVHNWNYHPMFDEYENIIRFDTLTDGIPKIEACLDTEIQPNEPLRAEFLKKHSYSAFKTQLGNIFGEVLTGER